MTGTLAFPPAERRLQGRGERADGGSCPAPAPLQRQLYTEPWAPPPPPSPSWAPSPEYALKLHHSRGWTPRAGALSRPWTPPVTSCRRSHCPLTLLSPYLLPNGYPNQPAPSPLPGGFFLILSSCLRGLHPPAPDPFSISPVIIDLGRGQGRAEALMRSHCRYLTV